MKRFFMVYLPWAITALCLVAAVLSHLSGNSLAGGAYTMATLGWGGLAAERNFHS